MKKIVLLIVLGLLIPTSWAISQNYNRGLKFNPNPAEQGEFVTIFGSGFNKESKVYFNGALIQSSFVDGTILQIRVPKFTFKQPVGAVGQIDVVVFTSAKPYSRLSTGKISIIIPGKSCSPDLLIHRLQALRTAESIYYGDTEGEHPSSLNNLVPRYISQIPYAIICREDSATESSLNKVTNFPSIEAADGLGGWGYINDMNSPDWGAIFINSKSKGPDGIPWNKK